MATSKLLPAKNIGLPEGFVSPFTRVEMPANSVNARISDGLCCVAMLTQKPLEEIIERAYQLGLKKHGPSWCYSEMIRTLLKESDLIASDDLEVASTDALGYVCMIQAEYDNATTIGRWVLWHHVKGTDAIPSFSYIIDPAYWVEPQLQVTRSFERLLTPKTPIYYLEITPKPTGKPAAMPKGK